MIAKELICQILFRPTKLRVMLGVLLVIGQGASAEQKITAEWVETQLKGASTYRTYAGGVVFEDSLEALKVQADSAYVDGPTYIFVSHLLFEDATRSIRAKKLVYDDETRMAKFDGNVLFRDQSRSLKAEQVYIWPDSERIAAQGQVGFTLIREKRHISANKLEYGVSGDLGIGVGSVVAITWENEDSLIIETDSLRFETEQKAFEFWGNSVIYQVDTRLSAKSGQYRENRLLAKGNPRVVWSPTAQTDSVWATSDTIWAHLENEVLDTLFFTSNAEINLVSRRDTSVARYSLEGNHGVMNMVTNNISTVTMKGAAKLGFEQTDMFAELHGDSICVWFKKGKLDSLVILGGSDGTFRGVDKGESRLLGQRKTLWFVNDALMHMRLEGNALCAYTALKKGEGNDVHVEGDLLDLYFEDGELANIDAQGKVRGIYLQDSRVKP